jgi:hypothetical protein
MAESILTAQKKSSPELNDDEVAARTEIYQIHRASTTDQTSSTIYFSDQIIVRVPEQIPRNRPQHKADASVEPTKTVPGNNRRTPQNHTPSSINTPDEAPSGITQATLNTEQLQQVDTISHAMEAVSLGSMESKKKQKKQQKQNQNQNQKRKQKKKKRRRNPKSDEVASAQLRAMRGGPDCWACNSQLSLFPPCDCDFCGMPN